MSKVCLDRVALWFIAGIASRKTLHFRIKPKAGVCCHKGVDYAVTSGMAGIVQDAETGLACRKPYFLPHIPGSSDDPEYCVLKFTATEGTFWIDGEFVTCEL